jgi:hypothetical protein
MKITALFLLLALIAVAFSGKLIQGSYTSNYYSTNPKHPFMTGTGERFITEHIKFAQAYHENPTVTASLNFLDSGNDSNVRIQVYTKNVSKTGFDLVIRTWFTTKVYGVGASWVANAKC